MQILFFAQYVIVYHFLMYSRQNLCGLYNRCCSWIFVNGSPVCVRVCVLVNERERGLWIAQKKWGDKAVYHNSNPTRIENNRSNVIDAKPRAAPSLSHVNTYNARPFF